MSDFLKVKKHRKNTTGYDVISEWTDYSTVAVNNDKMLNEVLKDGGNIITSDTNTIYSCTTNGNIGYKDINTGTFNEYIGRIIKVKFSNNDTSTIGLNGNVVFRLSSGHIYPIYYKGASVLGKGLFKKGVVYSFVLTENYVSTSVSSYCWTVLGDIDNVTGMSEPFSGATSTANGSKGLVPAPYSANKNSVLQGNGNWTDLKFRSIVSTDSGGVFDIYKEFAEISNNDKITYTLDSNACYRIYYNGVEILNPSSSYNIILYIDKKSTTDIMFRLVWNDYSSASDGLTFYTKQIVGFYNGSRTLKSNTVTISSVKVS